MADNTHSMSTRNRLKTDRASIINPTALTSHTTTANPPPTTVDTPTAASAASTPTNTTRTPKTPTPSKSSSKKAKAAAKKGNSPTAPLNARKKSTSKQPQQDEIPDEIPKSSPDAEMYDQEDTAKLTKTRTSRTKAATKKPAINQKSPESAPDVQRQDAEASPPPQKSPTSRPKVASRKLNTYSKQDGLKPRITARKSVSFGGATSEAATQTEDADVPLVQKVHEAYPNLPAGVPRDGDGVPSHYFSNVNGNVMIHKEPGQWAPTLNVKMTTNELSGAINRAREARRCTGGDECGEHCPLYGAEGHGA